MNDHLSNSGSIVYKKLTHLPEIEYFVITKLHAQHLQTDIEFPTSKIFCDMFYIKIEKLADFTSYKQQGFVVESARSIDREALYLCRKLSQ